MLCGNHSTSHSALHTWHGYGVIDANIVYDGSSCVPYRKHTDMCSGFHVFLGVFMDPSLLILAMIVVVLILVGAIMLKKDSDE